MRSAVKIALEVTEEQAALLDSQSKMANWLYNQLLERVNDLRKQYRQSQDKQIGKTLYTERGLRDLLPDLKAQYPFLKTVYSSVLKNAALRLSKAIRDYQDGKHGRRAKAPSTGPSFAPGSASGSRSSTMSGGKATRSVAEPLPSRWARMPQASN